MKKEYETLKIEKQDKRNLKAFAAIQGLSLSAALRLLLGSYEASRKNKNDNQH
jgi:hypothetical protein